MLASELITMLQQLIERDGDRLCYDSDNELIEYVSFEINERDNEHFIIFSEGGRR